MDYYSKAEKIVQAVQLNNYTPFELVKWFDLTLGQARMVDFMAPRFFGPGGQGERAFKRELAQLLQRKLPCTKPKQSKPITRRTLSLALRRSQ